MFLGLLGRRIKWGLLGRHIETVDPDFEPQDEGVGYRPMFDTESPPGENMLPWKDDLRAGGLPLSLTMPCLVPSILRRALQKKASNKKAA